MQPSLLIASPQMRDPYFERSVVLVWHHTHDDGAVGVVVNRHLKQHLGEVLESPKAIQLARNRDVPVAWGGPLESRSGTVVTLGRLQTDEGVQLPNGLAVTHSQDALLRLLASRDPLMLCLGYAGWKAGQLDHEIETGSWLWTDCSADIVFGTPPERRYDKALASLGLKEEMVWMQPVSE
jgi:putative transcriptional regulator